MSIVQAQTKLMREYYKDFSKYAKGRIPACKTTWVTSFTPVEILEALDIHYYYPESYAAVIAASGKEQELMEESGRQFLSLDCCSYSSCFEGCVSLEKGPRGISPKPDVLIATTNQCNTLANWWNVLAKRYGVPLIVLDYPGESTDRACASEYVRIQHEEFIQKMEELSGNRLCMDRLEELIGCSMKSVAAWNQITDEFAVRSIQPTELFDSISFLITARCKEDTQLLYKAMLKEYREVPKADPLQTSLFWLGYPLWYHPKRYLTEILEGFRISGANYITWWNLDYSGNTPLERLFQAYNYTFLNLTLESRTKRLAECIRKSGAVGTVTLHNKSCKCDFVSARKIGLPQVELEMDMIDRTFLDVERAKAQMEILKETLREI